MRANFDDFEAALNRAASIFKKIDRSKTIKLVSNLDADGITAAAIMVKTLERENFCYSIVILHQLNEMHAKDLASEDVEDYIFCDLGSGQLKLLNKYFTGKNVLVLDHHTIQGEPASNITHINPHDYGFDGSSEISASGVAFFFSRAVNIENESLSHLAIIGAIGDVQEKNGFKGLNKKILDIAVERKTLTVEKGPKLFGLEMRPLVKLLNYSSDLQIPGVSGSESGAVQFLRELGIKPTDSKGAWKTYYDLTEEEKKKLAEGLIIRRQNKGLPNAEDIFTNVYKLVGEKRGQFRDAKEFSTLLNSCGRMDNSGLGIGACLGDEKQRKKALASLANYKRTLVDCMGWYAKNQNNPRKVIKGKNYVILNAGTEVPCTVIGTIASMITKNGDVPHGTFVLGMAKNNDDTTKISLRVAGNPPGLDLKEIVSSIARAAGGQAGGHQYAAGAVIETSREHDFIEAGKQCFINITL
jgi:single-stranded-DNA-specific exonuclease